jgi:hypothetical protein
MCWMRMKLDRGGDPGKSMADSGWFLSEDDFGIRLIARWGSLRDLPRGRGGSRNYVYCG